MPRWSATTWTLVCLGCVVLLIVGDVTRRAVFPERVRGEKAAAGAPRDPADKWEPAVGVEAKDFTLPDYHKETRHLSDFKGKGEVVLTFFCGCIACRDLAKQLADTYKKNPQHVPTTVAVFTPNYDPAGTEGWINTTGAKFEYLYAVDHSIVQRYHGTPCPKVYVLDPDLNIRYISPPKPKGDLSNTPVLMDLAHLLHLKYQPPGA
jgi:peroxiredoxin